MLTAQARICARAQEVAAAQRQRASSAAAPELQRHAAQQDWGKPEPGEKIDGLPYMTAQAHALLCAKLDQRC